MLSEPEKYFSAGEYVSSADGSSFEIRNPFSGELAGKVSLASGEDFDKSLDYLERIFEKYKKEPVYVKADLLRRISQKLRENAEPVARLLSLETGKPIKYSRTEVERAVFTFMLGSEEASRIMGEVQDYSMIKGAERSTGIVRRFPLGVVLAITPWNFPVNLVAHKLSPALASGNVVLLKPASASALCGLAITRIVKDCCDEIGLGYYPLNTVTAPGRITEKYASDNRVKLVSFTGSSEVGWRLKRSMDRQRISLELGGNAGVIIDRTADIKDAVAKIVTGAFSQAGQSCISVQRVFVHDEIYDEFRRQLIVRTEEMKVGDPFEEATEVSSMITESEAIRAENWVKESAAGGAVVLTGGKREGAVLFPTIIENARREDKVNECEVFAPVLTLMRFKQFSDAVSMVNDSHYGLQAGVFTNDMRNVMYAYDNIETGGVIINHVSTFRMDAMPYGGVKDSGNAREGVRYAIEEMTERKTMVVFQ